MTDSLELTRELLRISGAAPQKCMKCGKCSGACPAYEEMEYHPHQFVSLIRDGRVATLMASDAALHCLSCMVCVERCPRGVGPGKLVEAVRLAMIRPKDANRLSPDRIPPMVDEDLPGQALVTAFRKFNK